MFFLPEGMKPVYRQDTFHSGDSPCVFISRAEYNFPLSKCNVSQTVAAKYNLQLDPAGFAWASLYNESQNGAISYCSSWSHSLFTRKASENERRAIVGLLASLESLSNEIPLKEIEHTEETKPARFLNAQLAVVAIQNTLLDSNVKKYRNSLNVINTTLASTYHFSLPLTISNAQPTLER